jgi:hypothetical protein
MNRKTSSWGALLPGLFSVCMSATLCGLAVYKPSVFASSMPLNFAALAVAARGIWKHQQRVFLYNGTAFLLSLSAILIISSTSLGSRGLAIRLLGCWAFAWIGLIFALKLALPCFGVGFRPPAGGQGDATAPALEQSARQWTDSIYSATVFLPLIGLLTMFAVGSVTFLLRARMSLSVDFGIDAATLAATALFLPIANLLIWFLFLRPESRAFVVRGIAPIKLSGSATLLTLSALLVWGLIVQVSYETNRVLAWVLCWSVLSMLLILLQRLGQIRPHDSADVRTPSFPEYYRHLIVLQVVIVFLSGSIYATLVLITK